MQWGFKSSDLPGRGSHDQDILRLCCDACNVPVVHSDQCSSGLLGPYRDTTSFTPVSLQFEGQSQARKHRNVVSAGTARFHCLTVYTYSIIIFVFHCFVKFTYKEEKNIRTLKRMVINIWFLLKGAKSSLPFVKRLDQLNL